MAALDGHRRQFDVGGRAIGAPTQLDAGENEVTAHREPEQTR